MAAASRPVTFGEKSAKRIGEAVRHVERMKVANVKGRRALLNTGDSFVTLKITSTIGVGVYNAKTYNGTVLETGVTDITEAAFGTLAATEDAIVYEPASVALGTGLPLVGLVTWGRVIGADSSADPEKLIVEIPPPGIRTVRYNTTDKTLEVAYIDNPATDDDWVAKINFVACP